MSAPLRVTWLTPEHVAEAREIGRLRHESAVRNQRPDHAPISERLALQYDEHATIAELALAVYTGLPWENAVLERLGEKRPDVGDDLDVKWTQYGNGSLIVKDREPSEWRYVLARGCYPKLELVGWISGADAKRYPADPRAAVASDHWVPADALHALEELVSSGRELACTVCSEIVLVHEEPREWIDPMRYVCGSCLKPVDRPQLRLVQGGRSETPAYDPQQAELPI